MAQFQLFPALTLGEPQVK
jgi:hypothetical protein